MRLTHLFSLLFSFVMALALAPVVAHAQQDFSKVEVKSSPLRGGAHPLTGAGGNMLASSGEDGTFLVDDQYAPLNARIVSLPAAGKPKRRH